MLAYRKLDVWQLAFDVSLRVMDLLDGEAWRTQFWLRDQISRAAASVPANIAEGNGRSTPLDYASFLDRARGSVYELDTWLLLVHRRGLVSDAQYNELAVDIERVSAMLFATARALRARVSLPSRHPGG